MVNRPAALARLQAASWLAHTDLQQILALLDGNRGRTRAVGGIVRDTLLGRPITGTDVDLATEILPGEVIARAQKAGLVVYPTGIDHGTVTLCHGALCAEITCLREDVETDGRHARVRFGLDWTRDAQRRDFTMNALYANADGTLFDPLGGLGDCLRGHVRFIGDPAQRIAEDRLRVYRFFRFSASHGHQHFDPDGLAACRQASLELNTLSAERVGSEMIRMLALPRVAKTLAAMSRGEIVDFSACLSMLERYEYLPVSPQAGARLAMIMGDSAPQTLQARWRLSNALVRESTIIRAAADLIQSGRLAEAIYRFDRVIADALAVACARKGWGSDKFNKLAAELAALPRIPFPLRARDLMALGMAPGKALGEELTRLEGLWIESRFALDRKSLLAQSMH